MHAILSRAAATTVVVVASLLSVPSAGAQAPSLAPAASADAYALDIDVKLGPTNLAIDHGPRARSSQDYPPQQAEMDEAAELDVDPIPAGGTLVQDIRILASQAGASGPEPVAAAEAVAEDVQLLNQASGPLIRATTLRAVSTTDCLNPPSAEGTEIVDLVVAGQEVPDNPGPNTEVAAAFFNPLGLKVIANEQKQAGDGRGLVVNALHIYNFAPPQVPGINFTGDIIVSHAMSTVNCPNGAGSTGNDNPIFIVKTSDKSRAKPGDTVTYTATIQNKATAGCPVNQVIDHLPAAFEYVSTDGPLGTTPSIVNRPGGGQDVVHKPTGVTIPGGGSITQTYVVTVRADALPGTYFNNVEILCANHGNFVKGLDAPVEVSNDNPPPPRRKRQCEDGRDNDGDGKIDFPQDPGCHSRQDDNERDEHPRTGGPENLAALAMLMLAAAYGLRRRRA